jgi:hypothetical protein
MKLKSTATIFALFFLTFSNSQASSNIVERILVSSFLSPLDLLPNSQPNAFDNTFAPPPSSARINLLKWNENPQDPPAPTERYSRLHHFGEWITLHETDNDCIDVRNRVLMRDSSTPFEMRTKNPCKVGVGTWYDPYSGTTFQNSTEVQIDHFVPLKDTYINGAWNWNYQTRCVYGNYLGYKDHLKPVSSTENMVKSDNSPAEYMPPNSAYRCDYLKTWLSIKLIWRLSMQREEAQKIKQLIEEENCDTSQFTFSVEELRNQRQTIQSMLSVCPANPPQSGPHSALIPYSNDEVDGLGLSDNSGENVEYY